MKNNLVPILVALALIGILVALLDPFMLLMPPPVAMLCLLLCAVLVTAFSGYILLEKAQDEREEAHRHASGRAAYLAGLAALTLGLLTQGFVEHHVDPWIAVAISVMIVAKIGARMAADRRN